MQRLTLAAGVWAAWLLLAGAPEVRSCGYGLPSPLGRFVEAQAVLVGRVVGVEDQNVTAFPFPGAGQPQEFTVAVVEVLQHFKGAEDQTQVRVGFALPQRPQPGQEVCFFLIEHHAEPFYLPTNQIHLPLLPDPNIDRELALYRRWGRLLREPLAGLTSKDEAERFDTARLLVAKYRTPPRRAAAKDVKTTPVDARESRLILEALAAADWARADPEDGRWSPWRVFNLLGPDAGWRPQGANDPAQLEGAAKRWLRANAATFRLSAFVRGG